MKKILMCAVVAMAVSGCETMSPQECKVADWFDVGMRDGSAGKTLSILDDRVKDCSKAGAQVNTGLYMEGRERGLQNFCRIENAVPLGLNGSSYEGVCPAAVDGEFRRRYQAGYTVHQARNRVNELDRRGERLQRELREADRDEEKQLKAADKDDDRKRIRKEGDDRRRKLREDMRDNDRATQRARDDLRSAESYLDMLR